MIYTVADKNPAFKECARCLMNTHATAHIHFDENGVCNYCRDFEKIKALTFGRPLKLRETEINAVLKRIKADAGNQKKYDCIIGLSGGVDSTYIALLCKRYGLNPLAVHFDNGWNSELAVKNIENIVKITGFDLYTYVVNWEEFRDLQKAYLEASVIDVEAISDHMIIASLFKLARENGIKYVISGTNHATEFVLARDWVYNKRDLHNILNIHRRFGKIPLKTFPKLGYFQRLFYFRFHRIEFVELLNLVDYEKTRVKQEIAAELGWRDYGGKHYESNWTKFYQGYLLVKKFGLDKRIGHLSNLIMNGELKKEDARPELELPPIPLEEEKELLEYVKKKLEFSEEEWERIMQAKPVPHEFYGTEKDVWYIKLFILLGKWRSGIWTLFKIYIGSPVKKLLLKLIGK